jgi:hypothetical protein
MQRAASARGADGSTRRRAGADFLRGSPWGLAGGRQPPAKHLEHRLDRALPHLRAVADQSRSSRFYIAI